MNYWWVCARRAAEAQLVAPLRALRAIHPNGAPYLSADRPELALLFTAGRVDPSLYAELRAELSNADRIDVLVSFITWSGLRKIIDVLETITAPDGSGRPGTRLRFITTTHTGATESVAVESSRPSRSGGEDFAGWPAFAAACQGVDVPPPDRVWFGLGGKCESFGFCPAQRH